MTRLTITAHGTPAPQGSKKAVTIGGRARIIEDNKNTKPWRKTVHDAATYATGITGWTTQNGPIHVDITFWMPRPKGHYGTGRNANQIKASAPAYPTTKPDIDKLARAVLDALTTAQIYADDSQVIDLTPRKRYAAPGTRPGAHITVTPLDPSPAAPARPAVGEDHPKAGTN